MKCNVFENQIIVRNRNDEKDCRIFNNSKLYIFNNYFLIEDNENKEFRFKNDEYFYVCTNTNPSIPSLNEFLEILDKDKNAKHQLVEMLWDYMETKEMQY